MKLRIKNYELRSGALRAHHCALRAPHKERAKRADPPPQAATS